MLLEDGFEHKKNEEQTSGSEASVSNEVSKENEECSDNNLISESPGNTITSLVEKSVGVNNSESKMDLEQTKSEESANDLITDENKGSEDSLEKQTIEDAPKNEKEGKASEQDAFEFEKDEYDTDIDQEDFSELSKEQLLDKLREIIEQRPIESIKSDVDAIKAIFYKIIKSERSKIKQELIEGGAVGEIDIPRDPAEDYLKELLTDYKNKKQEYQQNQEKEKFDNLRKKEEIIEKIKILANGEESLNKTFSEFKELQKQWNDIGQVPASETNKLWNNYQLQIENFYNFIKINKELRDLDLKKNLENKVELCEKAEDLLLETDVKKAYNVLQEYHELWKEIGPVEISKKDEIWERFSNATKKIRTAYQDYFIELREERKNNLKQKEALCEKVEEIVNNKNPESRKEWVNQTNEILEIQKLWKSIGMVPKEFNEEIYQRFRGACNRFFEEKKEFFATINQELKENLQAKLDICVQAEGLQESTDWKKTSELFFDLQKKWKEIGAVPQKQSDVVWKRFRAACDKFFNAKDEFFKKVGEEQTENSKKKKEIIETLNSFNPAEDQTENIKKIKEIQSEWTAIGLVPFKEKDKLQKAYREALDNLYKKLNLSKKHLDSHNYKARIDNLKSGDETKQLSFEKSKIVQKIKAINEDITLWENNMTFFAGDTKGLLEDFKNKVEKAKEEIDVLKNRKKMIDLALREINKNKE